jgi:hypothetical protein
MYMRIRLVTFLIIVKGPCMNEKGATYFKTHDPLVAKCLPSSNPTQWRNVLPTAWLNVEAQARGGGFVMPPVFN